MICKISVWLIGMSMFCGALLADDWSQWRGEGRDGVWRETGIVEEFAESRLEPLWRVPVGSGYSGPTVAKGRVYLTDRATEPKQIERILCFDASTGESIWSHAYDCVYENVGYQAGPRAAVTVADGRAFALGSMGNLHCMDAENGEVQWHQDLNAEYGLQAIAGGKPRMPVWGIAGAPLLYRDLVIIHLGGRPGACVVAFDVRTGEERWRALDDRGQYSSPILIRQADHDVCVVWTGDNVVGLDPETGKLYWQVQMTPKNMPIGIATPIVQGDRLFVTSFYDGALMLQILPDELDVEEVWRIRGPSERQTEALHSIISTPIWLGDYIYGVDSYGELRCLRADNGDRVWEDLTATPKARWSNIHFVRNADRVWMFNERGQLIISRLSPQGFTEISRADLLDPTKDQLGRRGGVCWSHPAFADKKIFARNDKELVCASLAQP